MSENNSTPFDLQTYINHHVENSSDWQIPLFHGIHLPPHLTVHSLMLFFCIIFLVFIFLVVYRKEQKIPSGATNLLEALVLFIRDEIAIANLGAKDGRALTPLFCTFFFFILGLNLMGMIPIFGTATSNINVTAALALITFSFMTVGAIIKNGFRGFFSAFINPEIPVALRFLLFPLEFLGLFIKTFALTIRLFANMLAGHMVILALLGLVTLLGFVALPAVLLA